MGEILGRILELILPFSPSELSLEPLEEEPRWGRTLTWKWAWCYQGMAEIQLAVEIKAGSGRGVGKNPGSSSFEEIQGIFGKT